MSGHLGFVVVLVTGFYTHTITLCLSVFVITDHKSINLVVTEPDFQISTLDIFFSPQNQIFTIFPKKKNTPEIVDLRENKKETKMEKKRALSLPVEMFSDYIVAHPNFLPCSVTKISSVTASGCCRKKKKN